MNVRLMAAALALGLGAPCAVVAQSKPLGTPLPGKALGTPLESDAGPQAFLVNQLSFDRVARARDTTDDRLRELFAEREVPYPAPEIYLRVFKHERVLELWARGEDDGPFSLIREYPVCALPGQLGPKKQMGDFQVPEGFYFIDEFNPRSAYHLSLRVSYPNIADRMRREALALGGDIFVHGGCETVGCVPIENENIEEVYWLAVQAMDAGQRLIPIHIFPSRMDAAQLRWLDQTYRPDRRLRDFWRNLAEGYDYFEETRRVPWVTVDSAGRYAVPAPIRVATDSVEADTATVVPPVPDSLRGPQPDSGAAPGARKKGGG